MLIMIKKINNIIGSDLNLFTLKFKNKEVENEYAKMISKTLSQSFTFQSILLSITLFSFFVTELCLSEQIFNFFLKTGGIVLFLILSWLIIYIKKQNLIEPITFIVKLILNVFLIYGLEEIESVLAHHEIPLTSYVFLFIFGHFQKNLYISASWFHSFFEALFGILYLMFKLGKNNIQIENPFFIFFFLVFWVSTFNLYANEKHMRDCFQKERSQKILISKFSNTLIDIEPEINIIMRFRKEVFSKIKPFMTSTNGTIFSNSDPSEKCYFPFEIEYLNNFAKNKELHNKDKLNKLMENIKLEDEENACIKNYMKNQIDVMKNKFNLDFTLLRKKKCYEINPQTAKKEKYLIFISFNFWQSELFIVLKFKTLFYEQELENLRTTLKNKDRLLATITHDLRTPLNGMLHFINQARETKDLFELDESLHYAQINGDLLMLLINDILDFALLQENKMRLNVTSFNLKNTIDEVLILLQPRAKFQCISLELDYKLEKNFLAESDPSRLKQILINLIGNAIKFTKKGFVRLKVFKNHSKYINFEVIDTGVGIEKNKIITLGNPYASYNTEGLNENGIGLGLNITKQILSKLGPTNKLFISSKVGKGSKFCFTIYKSLEKENQHLNSPFKKPIFVRLMTLEKITKNCSDSSIELNIDKISSEFSEFDIVEEQESIYSNNDHEMDERIMNERIMNERKEIGCVNPESSKLFLETLNIRKQSSLITNKEDNLLEKFRNVIEKKEFKNKFHLLLADDNMFNLLILETNLKKFKFIDISWEIAYNGEVAIEKFKKNNKVNKNQKSKPFNIIIMDGEMPIINGFQAASEIKRLAENGNYFDCLIVGHSACNTDIEIENCMAHGMKFFLMKPFTEKELVKVLYQCWKELENSPIK